MRVQIMLKFLKNVLSFGQVLATSLCFGQTAIGPNDVLVYERLEKPSAGSEKNSYVWPSGGKRQEVNVERKSSGQLLLASDGKLSLFDPKTFAMTDVPNSSLEPTIQTDKASDGFPSGSRWKISLARPHTAPCGGTLKNELQSVVDGEIPLSTADGKFTDPKGVSVSQAGTYSSCTGSGEYTRIFHYSSTLQAPTMIQSVTFYEGRIWSGYKMTLKEIRRAQ
jgi:hypothetical protein